MKTVFIGTPEFGAIILEELIKSGYRPDLVISETDKPVGRKYIVASPPVKIIAQKYNIPVLQPEKILNLKSDPSTNSGSSRTELRDEILNLKPDLMIVAAYGQIIPREIIDIPKYGALNVHPSLLPKYRGPSPIQAAILNGDAITGVTIMLLDDKMDHGPIVSSLKFKVQSLKLAYAELHNKLAELGAGLLIDTIPKWAEGEIKAQPQDEKMATYTKILKKEDGKIDWAKNAEDIDRQIRALSPWPGAFTQIEDNKTKLKTIKIWKAEVKEQTKQGPFGVPGKTYLATNDQIAVQTRKDFLIIEELQMEGKKRMTAEEFLRGRSDFVGTVLK